MSSEKTPNLGMHKWRETDYVQRTEFNDNFTKIDEHAKQVTEQLAQDTTDLNQRGFNLKSYGAKGDKVQDDTSFLQNLINTLKKSIVSSTNVIDIPSGNYRVTSTISLPLYVKLRSKGIVKISFEGEGALFHIYNDKDPKFDGINQTATNLGDVLDGNFILTGQRKIGQIGVRIGEPELNILHVTHTAWSSFSDVYIDNFDVGIMFTQKQTYITRFFNCTITNCNKAISDEGNTHNSGELITWTDCAFHNSDLFLEVNSEINHAFKGCSIDYNKKGIQFNNNKFNTQRFTDCWIEASNTTDISAFAETSNTSKAAFVVFTGSHIFYRDKYADFFLKGNMRASFINNEITLNRYTNKEIGALARSAVMCDDSVDVVEARGTMFHENPIMISRSLCLNRNSDFELDQDGATNFVGFTRVGGANAQVSTEKFYSGTKSIKVIGGGTNYIDFETELFEVQTLQRLYGQCLYYLDSSKPSLNIETKVYFYMSDGTTQIGDTVTSIQNIAVDSANANKWYALLNGFATNTGTPIVVPPRATKCKVRVTIGSIGSANVYLDNFMVSVV